MGMIRAFAFVLAASPALAEDLTCTGETPLSTWSLLLRGDQATFDYITETRMDVMLRTDVEGRPGSNVLTLVGMDTGIALIDQRSCGAEAAPLTLTYLTQRGETPVAFHGCCTRP